MMYDININKCVLCEYAMAAQEALPERLVGDDTDYVTYPDLSTCPVESCQKQLSGWTGVTKHLSRGHPVHESVYTKRRVLTQFLQAYTDEHGTPTQREIDADPAVPGKGSFVGVFGTWNKALEAAGQTPNRKLASNGELLEEMRFLAGRLDQETLSVKQMRAHGRADTRTIRSRFGSWNSALRRAGLDISIYSKVDTEDALADLERVAELIGRVPGPSHVTKHGTYSRRPYRNRFGSVRNACIEIGYEFMRDRLERPDNAHVPTSIRKRGIVRCSKVAKRDGKQCRVCDESNVRLGGHHIEPLWIASVERAKTFDELDCLSNLVSLCATCHKALEGLWPDADHREFVELAKTHYILR